MLTGAAIDRICESVEAELAPRATNLSAALLACDSEFAARGQFNSSMRVQKRGLVACQELEVRADIIWSLMRRCRPWFGEPDDALLDSLSQQIRHHIDAQATAVLQLAGQTPTDPQRRAAAIEVPITACREQLVKKFWSQARFFVDELKHPAATDVPNSSMNFYGNVGAVQTGLYATAHVQIGAADSARLVEALEGLREALPSAADMAPDAREQSAGLVTDIIAAARVDKPNRLTLNSLFMGLAVTVQTVASLRPAWDAVRQAAAAIGVHLP
jgi:hypothetical protein